MNLTKEQVYIIAKWIEKNIMRNDRIMFEDVIRGDDGYQQIDLIEVIASLFEIIHRAALGEPYHYMFHWANKIGSWVDNDEIFIRILEEHYQEVIHKKTVEKIADLCKQAENDLKFIDKDKLAAIYEED